MSNLKIHIKNVYGFKDFTLEIPIEQGLHAICGTNGVGKSTLMALLSIVFRTKTWDNLRVSNNSEVIYCYNEITNTWQNNSIDGWKLKESHQKIHIDGFLEGSIIHGTRFADATKKKYEMHSSANKILETNLVDADSFINDNFNNILHGINTYYPKIKKIKNRKIAGELGFDGVPYYINYDDGLIGQLGLSSGENLLLSLLHFLNNKIYQQKKLGNPDKSFILIDEVELALHPVAIVRLSDMLYKLSKEYNLSIFFSTHSTELLRKIHPDKIFYLQKHQNSQIEVINPCYASYATRFLYNHDGYDFLILVEDELAKYIIEKVINDENLYRHKLIHILPVGGWRNTMDLHLEIVENNLLINSSTRVMSILDGDIKTDCTSLLEKQPKYKKLNHAFLPINSLEKYFLHHFIIKPDANFLREINDRFFKKTTIYDIISNLEGKIDNGKPLWKAMKTTIGNSDGEVKVFTHDVCSVIYKRVEHKDLVERIKRLISGE